MLRSARRTGDARARAEALETLDRIARGGIHDQVGGGFHRYSTDRQWLVPHFEKMLYDNALLATAYLDAYQVSGDQRFAEVARDTLRYLHREMTSPDGAFFSATDADSPTPGGGEEEGWFFTWTPDEIAAAVGTDRAALVEALYGVTATGNFDGRNILHVALPLDEVARRAGRSVERTSTDLEAARRGLYQARARRPAPLRDDKILAAWNGLAISAFARGARVLRDPELAREAATAAGFVLERMTRDGHLARSYVGGEARHEAVLDDYAFVVAGLLDLYEATFDPRWLAAAITLQGTLDAEFWDEARGGYFLTSRSGEALLVRQKDVYDGALPSGNAVAVHNLLRLHEITTEDGYRRRAERTLAAFSADLRARPGASPRMLAALDFYLDAPKEILLIRPSAGDASLDPFLDVLARRYVPNAVVVATTEGSPADELALRVPLVGDKTARDGQVTAYVCENRVCALPTTDPAVFSRQIESVRPYPE